MLKKTPGLSSRTSEPSNEEKVKTINELRHKFPLADLLRICRIAKSSYYYGLKALKVKESKDKELRDKILEIYRKSRCRYGFKCITLMYFLLVLIKSKSCKTATTKVVYA